MIALRVLMGISQGPIIPACLNLFSSWVPRTERSTTVSMAYGGITVSNLNRTRIEASKMQFNRFLFNRLEQLWELYYPAN